MSDDEPVQFPCPTCGEADMDSLIWINDESVRCATCGEIYKPGQES